MHVWQPKCSHRRHQDGDWTAIVAEVEALRTVEEVDAYWTRFLLHRHRDFPEPWSLSLREICAAKRDELLILETKHQSLDREWAGAMERDQ
jgi:hypothetical protein